MYPLKFENLYYEKIWGGRDLELFRDNLPEGNIGESWDVACHKHGMSVVKNGEYKGKTLRQLIDMKGKDLIGSKVSKDWFPLLIKLINAKQPLSVQVHPNDEYARRVEGEMGKTEVWYVVRAFEGANLIVGTKGDCTKEEFRKSVEDNTVEKHLNKIPVKEGDIYFIKSGTVHAIGGGVIIAEIQQSSDLTYRLYDYGRGRELHIDKAMDVIDFSLRGEKSIGTFEKAGNTTINHACSSKDFVLDVVNIKDEYTESSSSETFYVFTCVNGSGEILFNGSEKEDISMGESILIPASLGKYTIKGNIQLVKSYMPVSK